MVAPSGTRGPRRERAEADIPPTAAGDSCRPGGGGWGQKQACGGPGCCCHPPCGSRRVRSSSLWLAFLTWTAGSWGSTGPFHDRGASSKVGGSGSLRTVHVRGVGGQRRRSGETETQRRESPPAQFRYSQDRDSCVPSSPGLLKSLKPELRATWLRAGLPPPRELLGARDQSPRGPRVTQSVTSWGRQVRLCCPPLPSVS